MLEYAYPNDTSAATARGKLGQERDLRRQVFVLAADEAKTRMARRQARRGMLVEATHAVAVHVREERRDRWQRMLLGMILAVRRRRTIRFSQEKQAQLKAAAKRRREAVAAEAQRWLAAARGASSAGGAEA